MLGGIAFTPARFVRSEGSSSPLYALFEKRADSAARTNLELSPNLVRCNPKLATTHCKLIDEPGTANQLWRSRSHSAAAAAAAFSNLDANVSSWVAGSQLGLGAIPMLVGDMVYLLAECSIGQITSISPSGALTTDVATEVSILTAHSKRATFQFLSPARSVSVSQASVIWPIDLQFDPATACFVLRKSTALETV